MQKHPAAPLPSTLPRDLHQVDVLIIGGGIIGASTAYELSKTQPNAKILVIDKGDMGYGCSFGNAGWMTPCFAFPLPRPGMLLKSLGWMLDPQGPLYIHPAPSLLLVRWLLRFLSSMTQEHLQRSTHALTELSKYSLKAYAQLDQEHPGAFGFTQRGLLMVAQSAYGLHGAVEEMKMMSSEGIPGQELSGQAVRDLEPAVTGKIHGGVYFPQEAHAEPLAVVQTLVAAAQARGVHFASRTEVFDFVLGDGKIKTVRTTQGDIQADQVVLATGTWSEAIARKLRLNVPVMGGKGYGIIVPELNPMPKIPMMLIEKKIAVTPRNGSLRLAGTLELVAKDDSISTRRMDAIVSGARQFLNVPEDIRIESLWRGLRPCTPDGVPIISRSRHYSNLVISTGHQMLGLQSGLGSGRLTADLVTGATPTFDPQVYRADRF